MLCRPHFGSAWPASQSLAQNQRVVGDPLGDRGAEGMAHRAGTWPCLPASMQRTLEIKSDEPPFLRGSPEEVPWLLG